MYTPRALAVTFLGLLMFAAPLLAKDFNAGPITLPVPRGFDGPETRPLEQGATTSGFTKPRADSKGFALLQVTVHDLGPDAASLKKSARGEAAAKYLVDFVEAIGRQRTRFQRTEPASTVLAGLPAAKLRWTGERQGREMVGVMYCVLVGSKVIALHTQDFDRVPTAAMEDAMAAIEASRLTRQ